MENTSIDATEGSDEREHRKVWLEHYHFLQQLGHPIPVFRTHDEFCDSCGLSRQEVNNVLSKVRKKYKTLQAC